MSRGKFLAARPFFTGGNRGNRDESIGTAENRFPFLQCLHCSIVPSFQHSIPSILVSSLQEATEEIEMNLLERWNTGILERQKTVFHFFNVCILPLFHLSNIPFPRPSSLFLLFDHLDLFRISSLLLDCLTASQPTAQGPR